MDTNESTLHGYEMVDDTTQAQVNVLRGINILAADKFLRKSVKLERITYVRQDNPNVEFYVRVATSPSHGKLRVFDPDHERIILLDADDCDIATPYVFDCGIWRYGFHESKLANVREYTETRVAFLAALNMSAKLVYLFRQTKDKKTGTNKLSLALPNKVQELGVSIPDLHVFMGGVLASHIRALQNHNGNFDAREDKNARIFPAFKAQKLALKASVKLPELPAQSESPELRLQEHVEERMLQDSMETSES